MMRTKKKTTTKKMEVKMRIAVMTEVVVAIRSSRTQDDSRKQHMVGEAADLFSHFLKVLSSTQIRSRTMGADAQSRCQQVPLLI
jgi:phosphoribosyl-ATP pyrophosphohydrolase